MRSQQQVYSYGAIANVQSVCLSLLHSYSLMTFTLVGYLISPLISRLRSAGFVTIIISIRRYLLQLIDVLQSCTDF